MDVNEIKKQASIATKWSAITEIFAKCVSPITNMVLARLLTPEMFGVVATVTMIVSFADMFTDAGFQKYLVQHDFDDEDDLNKSTNVAFWTNLILSLVIWGIICVFSNAISNLVGNPGMGNVICVAAISLPLTSFSSIQMARYKREFDFKTLFYVRMITAIVPFVITIPIAIITRSYWAMILGTLSTNIINAVILTVLSKWKPKLFYSFKRLKDMFAYSFWIMFETISVWFTSYIGTFIVGVFLSTYYVGLYKTAMTTVNQIMALITGATSMPLFAALSRLKNDETAMLETYYSFIGAISTFIVPLGMGIWLYRDAITFLLLGSQWSEAAEFVGLWGLMSSVGLVFGTYCNGLYNAKGKTYLSLVAQLLHLVVLVPVLIWSAPKGFELLYISRSLVRIEFVLVQFILMKKFMHIKMVKMLRECIPAALCTAIYSFIAVYLQSVSDSIFWHVFSIVCCVVIYLLVFRMLFREKMLHAFETFGVVKKEKR